MEQLLHLKHLVAQMNKQNAASKPFLINLFLLTIFIMATNLSLYSLGVTRGCNLKDLMGRYMDIDELGKMHPETIRRQFVEMKLGDGETMRGWIYDVYIDDSVGFLPVGRHSIRELLLFEKGSYKSIKFIEERNFGSQPKENEKFP